MFVALGWMLLAGLPLAHPTAVPPVIHRPRPSLHHPAGRSRDGVDRPGRSVPPGRGRAGLPQRGQPAHVTVFRVDTDGRMRVLFPREPWGDTLSGTDAELRDRGARGGGSFMVDDYPGVGYLLAVASPVPFNYTTSPVATTGTTA